MCVLIRTNRVLRAAHRMVRSRTRGAGRETIPRRPTGVDTAARAGVLQDGVMPGPRLMPEGFGVVAGGSALPRDVLTFAPSKVLSERGGLLPGVSYRYEGSAARWSSFSSTGCGIPPCTMRRRNEGVCLWMSAV